MPERVRWFTRLALSFVLVAPIGCARSVRPIGSANSQEGVSGAAPGQLAATKTVGGKVPAPPPPERPPPYDAIEKLRLMNGPQLCASHRPDLVQTFVSLQMGGSLSPEEMLLLREWIRAAWADELGDEPAAFQPPACETHFLCLAGSGDAAVQLASALLRALSAPGGPAFYRTRAATLKDAEDWDRSSADWKLNTAARALRQPSAGRTRVQHLEEVNADALRAVVERNSGATKAQSLPLYSLEKRLSAALVQSTVTVSGPTWRKGQLARLKEQWTRKNGTFTEEELLPAPPAAVRLEKNAPELTQAALVWELPPDTLLGPIETALSLLALRWEARAHEASRVRVQSAGGLYSLPALRVDGPPERVLSAVSELSEEYDRLISTYGSPSEKEWQAAELRNPPRGHFEPRCQSAPLAEDAVEAVRSSRDALRAAGAPTIVVWGTDEPTEAAE